MRRDLGIVGMMVVVLWGLSAGQAQQEQTTSQGLFTPQEAERLQLTEEEWTRPVLAGRSRALTMEALGPRIVIQSPRPQEASQGPTLAASTPMDLIVAFEERGAAVAMQTLQVYARKGLFTKSLTERLQPYIRGTRLEGTGLEVPEGKFWIEVEIADIHGVQTTATYRLEVKGKQP